MIGSARSFIAAAVFTAVLLFVPAELPIGQTAYAAGSENAAAYAEELSETEIVVRADDHKQELALVFIIGMCLFAAGVGGHEIYKKLNG